MTADEVSMTYGDRYQSDGEALSRGRVAMCTLMFFNVDLSAMSYLGSLIAGYGIALCPGGESNLSGESNYGA
jgi:hypothetical protein